MLVRKHRWFDGGLGNIWYCGEALMEDGTIIPLHTDRENLELYFRLLRLKPSKFYTSDFITTEVDLRPDYVEMVKSKRARGKKYLSILHEISKEIENI